MPKNMDESSFEHFIEHVVDMRENSNLEYKLGLVRPNTSLISHQKVNHNLSQANLQLIDKKS